MLSASRRLTQRVRKPRVLCYVIHYFRGAGAYTGVTSAYVGRSSTSPAIQRREVVTRVVKALRALPYDVDVQVCGVPEASLVPIDVDLSEVKNPQHFTYASIENLVRSRAGYDWFLCLEDDVLVPPHTLDRMIRFERRARVNEVLLPNRLEVAGDGLTYCVDLLAFPGWHGDRREFEGLRLDIATNPHSGVMFLSRRQLEYAIRRVDLTRRDVIVGGYLESALANLHEPFLLWRSRDDLEAHHVLHLDTWTAHSPRIDLPGKTVGRTPATARGHIDSLALEGVMCTLQGWAATGGGRPARIDEVRLGGSQVPSARIWTIARPDVRIALGQVGDGGYGFRSAFSLLDIQSEDLTAGTITVKGGGVALTAEWPRALAVRAVQHAPKVPEAPTGSALIDRLRTLLADADCYLEYGVGGSTLLAAEVGVPRSYGVDGDPSWLSAVEHRVRCLPSGGHRTLLHADIGSVDARGYPIGLPTETTAGDYALDVWRRIRSDGVWPDVVLVQGRFRVACFLATLLHARPGTRVVFDGYRDGLFYQVVETIVTPCEHHDRAAEFEVPDSLTRDRAWSLLARHVGDAR